MPYSSICAHCGNVYITRQTPHGITCSRSCRNRHFRKTREIRKCTKCGNDFEAIRSSVRHRCDNCRQFKRPPNPPSADVSESDKAYLAGIIDGEGCISATKGKDHRSRLPFDVRLRVSVSMTDRIVPDLLVRLYGGYVTENVPRNNNKKSIAYRWEGHVKRGEILLRDILPYLRVKRAQAEYYLRARETFTGRIQNGIRGAASPTAADLAERLTCVEAIRALNQHQYLTVVKADGSRHILA